MAATVAAAAVAATAAADGGDGVAVVAVVVVGVGGVVGGVDGDDRRDPFPSGVRCSTGVTESDNNMEIIRVKESISWVQQKYLVGANRHIADIKSILKILKCLAKTKKTFLFKNISNIKKYLEYIKVSHKYISISNL